MFLTNDELFNLMLLKASSGSGATEDTAIGNPLTFQTDLARPLRSLLIPFTPIQTGSGDPSPVNVRPIVPWDGLKVVRLDENLLVINRNSEDTRQGITYTPIKQDDKTVAVCVKGTRTGTNPFFNLNYVNGTTISIPVGSYKIYGGVPGVRVQLFYKDENGTERIAGQDYGEGATAIVPEGSTASWLRLLVDTDNEVNFVIYPVLINVSSTYDSVSIPFPEPVYGGTLDVVSGVLTVEWAGFSAKWKDGINADNRGTVTRKTFALPFTAVSPTSSAQGYCNVAGWKWNFESDDTHFYTNGTNAYVFLPNDTDGETDIQIVNKLATSQEITLTPQQIAALVGNNTIWSDADGSMTAIYYKKG